MSAYTAPSQIAHRQLDYFSGKHLLIAGEVEDDFPVELLEVCASVSILCTNYSYYRSISKRAPTLNCYFDIEWHQSQPVDMVLLYWPKAKTEAQYLLAMLMDKLGVDTEIAAVGETRSGIKSIEKMFAPYGPINKYDSARRCAFYWGQCQKQAPAFELDSWFKSFEVMVNDECFTVKSLPGVFSHGELDLGTQLLLKNLPALSGKVLDFGCGAGVIGAYLALKNPQISLEMCDINAFALASSRATLIANQLDAKVFASDIYSDTRSDYQTIVSNPPFHSGLETHYQAAETLLGQAPNHLNSHGNMWIVANSFLQYPPIIKEAFGDCQTVDKNRQFAIYHAAK
ncbi:MULTISPECIES: 16S rRNA (guanine(1207)-N(2))-methyltransferase RsmC [unclassified Vibrio]|uniref:Ribosomal RNA small subunit methyltransferase C n=1 Tax=Vibrio sp. HB236076 TaxID=3232307 RepID=A0AB39HD01_9VIBR|nr:16S rRNA (guanine(1207)-N(2))-methyltransferase RsmC [Vibrio sp. HB161653]MDP5254032.1 16S rRNA (guanine(1207)-N(2))-methyltransferase RsmC [Vibrio sp. HB161653]